MTDYNSMKVGEIYLLSRELIYNSLSHEYAVILEIIFFISLLLIITRIALSLVSIGRFIVRVLKFFLSFFGKYEHTIQIRDEFTRKPPYGMAITTEDVHNYLQEVAKKNPLALKGIDEVLLVNSDPKIPKLLGTYEPKASVNRRGVIKIYPLRYDRAKKRYTMPLYDGSMIVAFTEKEAKELQLFTLGHEIGHNVIYRRKGVLAGGKVEKQCDKFSESLSLARNPKNFGDLISIV